MEFGHFAETYLWVIALFVFLFLVDDLFVDAVAYLKNLKPKSISKEILFDSKNSKMLAILIANWKEENVLEAMVHGNMAQLTQENVHLFLGVYPNDTATLAIATRMESIYPRVHVVVNRQPGPTYKGQMLNEIIDAIFDFENELHFNFEGFVLHDSEDILDPKLPYLYSLGLRQADFIQTPVYSLPVKMSELTAGTYIDEFAEIHTKDLLVRQYLGAGIPSAGVGTCISRELLLTFYDRQKQVVFLPDSLTEDYQLGLQAARWKFKSVFLCYYLEGTDTSEIISTREYFPDQFWNSVRQKTRWTTGIAFQGFRNIGWFGDFAQRYFLWRDRRGPLNGLLSLHLLMGLLLFPFLELESRGLWILLALNTVGVLVRFAVRIQCVQRIYGDTIALLSILRWPVAMAINTWSGLRSTRQYLLSLITGKQIKWIKTEHRLPLGFGLHPPVSLSMNSLVPISNAQNEQKQMTGAL